MCVKVCLRIGTQTRQSQSPLCGVSLLVKVETLILNCVRRELDDGLSGEFSFLFYSSSQLADVFFRWFPHNGV